MVIDTDHDHDQDPDNFAPCKLGTNVMVEINVCH